MDFINEISYEIILWNIIQIFSFNFVLRKRLHLYNYTFYIIYVRSTKYYIYAINKRTIHGILILVQI